MLYDQTKQKYKESNQNDSSSVTVVMFWVEKGLDKLLCR